MTRTSLAFFRVALGAVALTSLASVATAEEGVAVKNLLGSMGLISPDKDRINYRERAPLVIPPKLELREPDAAASRRAANPQWPRDPDVLEKQRKSQEARLPSTLSETRRMSDDNNTRLTPQEMRAGINPNARGPNAPVIRRGDNARDELLLTPDQLRSQGRLQEESNMDGDEPTRRTLTDPPAGMRKSASGGPVKRSFGPRAPDQQVLDADPRNYIREQAGRANADD